MKEFRQADEVPDFIQALEFEDLAAPGTVAHLQLRVDAALEAPQRVTLGAWPNIDLRSVDRRCNQMMTLWEVPVLPMRSITQVKPGAPPDSAVVMYWPDRELAPGAHRDLGFTYGLGRVASRQSQGKLGLTVGGSFRVGGEFTVTALVSKPVPDQELVLHLTEGLRLVRGAAAQKVLAPANAASQNYSVSWRVRALKPGKCELRVESSTGTAETLNLTIVPQKLFD
jgi:hypothetical protein